MARKPKDDKETSEAPAQDDAAAPASRFPLFYSAPRPLEASRHAILDPATPNTGRRRRSLLRRIRDDPSENRGTRTC